MQGKEFDTGERFQPLINRSLHRALLTGITLATLLALVSPVFTRTDGFPVSTQPMYAAIRPETTAFVTANGRTETGDIVSLPITVIADTDDPLVAQSRLAQLAEDPNIVARCQVIADRAGSGQPIVSIEVVRVTHDATATATGEDGLIDREVLTECQVEP